MIHRLLPDHLSNLPAPSADAIAHSERLRAHIRRSIEDAGGWISFAAFMDLALHAPAAIFQEVVRATLATWYRDLVTDLPEIRAGMVQAPTGAGLCTALHPEVKRREDAVIRESGTPRDA